MKNSKYSSSQLSLFDPDVKVRHATVVAKVCNESQYVSCSECAFLQNCGGLEQYAAWGCSSHCVTCTRKQCDFTCFSRLPQMVERMQEVRGFLNRNYQKLKIPAANTLPVYIPVVYNQSCRLRTLDIPMVAIPFHRALKLTSDGHYRPLSTNAKELREEFKISADSKVLITGVAFDRYLERYWQYAEHHGTARKLSDLDVFGMTVPNFSHFTDVTQPHILYNNRRAQITAECMSQQGLSVIPHVNASMPRDWQAWTDLFRQQPQINMFSKEFQTGLSDPDLAERAINELASLQDKVGRELHPILFGAAPFIPQVRSLFREFTIVDSRPFMSTVMRRKFVLRDDGTRSWVRNLTERGEDLDDLLAHNVKNYALWIAMMASKSAASTKTPSRTLPQMIEPEIFELQP